MSSKIKVTVVSLHKFFTRGLVVSPDLLGYCHQFEYEQSKIKIELPAKDKLNTEGGSNELLPIFRPKKYGSIEGLFVLKSNRDKSPSEMLWWGVDQQTF